jgi:hypothetical protein
MVIEAAVAIGSAVEANSLTLLAFGIVELRHGQTVAEIAEQRAARIGGALLFALATYVVGGAGWKLWTQQGAEFSLPGLIVSALAIPTMSGCACRKPPSPGSSTHGPPD